MTTSRSVRAIAIAAGLWLGASTLALAESVYHRGNTAEPETLDQHLTSTVYESNILRDLYESLVIDDAKALVAPGAAESWTVSDDGLVYTFALRANAKWSNGDDLTADDFVYSYQRILDPATGAKYADVLYPIKGAEAVNKGEADASTLGVRAVDAKTVEITLANPTPYFLQLLTHQTSLPVHQCDRRGHMATDFTKPGNMVTNGAYTLATEWVPNGAYQGDQERQFP